MPQEILFRFRVTSFVFSVQFRESLVQSLLLGTPIEKLKPGPRQQSASHSKRELADHKPEEKKDLRAISTGDALAAVRRKGSNSEDQRLMRQQRK